MLERLLHSLGSVAMDTGTTERGAVAGPRRATHGPAVGHRNLVGVQQESSDEEQDGEATGGGAGSGRVHGGSLLSCTFGSSAQCTGPDSTGGRFLRYSSRWPLPTPPITCCPQFFQTAPGSTVWIGDSASSVYVTGSGNLVYSKRHPLPAEAFLLLGDGRKLSKGGVFWVTRRRFSLQG